MESATLVDGPEKAAATFLFAHGAGAPMDSPFMKQVAEGPRGARRARRPLRVSRTWRSGGRKASAARRTASPCCARGGPSSSRVSAAAARVAVGGKSMGGRIASMIADEVGARALVCFGYPFHPPGQPRQLRTAHLQALRTPALILQGTRDAFGVPDEVAGYGLSPAIRVEWIEDGDHSFKPPARSGRTETDNVEGRSRRQRTSARPRVGANAESSALTFPGASGHKAQPLRREPGGVPRNGRNCWASMGVYRAMKVRPFRVEVPEEGARGSARPPRAHALAGGGRHPGWEAGPPVGLPAKPGASTGATVSTGGASRPGSTPLPQLRGSIDGVDDPLRAPLGRRDLAAFPSC